MASGNTEHQTSTCPNSGNDRSSDSTTQAKHAHLSFLPLADWNQLAAQHRSAIELWTEPFRSRRRESKSHPVHDFLFIYYQFSPAKLEQWHPGVGVGLRDVGDDSWFESKHYRTRDGLTYCDPTLMNEKEVNRLGWIADLLRQTDGNRANYSCLGLHEWAMVYQGQEVRHEKTTKLRLPQSEIDHVVETRPITCTHFDAFRFFADAARPLNRVCPTLESRPSFEQPACIHANMDLYKWAFKAMPWIGSDLLRRCFELAMAARAVDMRASPYDLSEYDVQEPIRIETADGRKQYEQHQREIAEQARPLRMELANKIEHILSFVERSNGE